MLYLQGMFINKKGLKELVEKRSKLKDLIIADNKKVDEHTKAVQELRQKSANLHKDFGEVNEKINKLVLAEALEECSDTQVPHEMIIKDGKPFMTFIDFIEKASKEANEAKDIWRAKYEKSTK